ncbi:MAG: hypothetical protein MJ032_01065 [Acidaminococcaceae bacterium]|nr:hypothetical protein [Acidaminococcaceae bacterium]
MKVPNFTKMRSKSVATFHESGDTFTLIFCTFHFEKAVDFELAKAGV